MWALQIVLWTESLLTMLKCVSSYPSFNFLKLSIKYCCMYGPTNLYSSLLCFGLCEKSFISDHTISFLIKFVIIHFRLSFDSFIKSSMFHHVLVVIVSTSVSFREQSSQKNIQPPFCHILKFWRLLLVHQHQ